MVQVTSEFLVLWFDCCASHKRVLVFMVCGASNKSFLGFVWFDFCTSNKRVLLFMVFTIAQVTSAFLFLWFD